MREKAKKYIRKIIKLNDNREIGDDFILWSFIKLFANIGKLSQAAAALTHHTLFAAVPIIALMLAASTFMGYGDAFKEIIGEVFADNKELAAEALTFAESYLANARTGYWLGAIAGGTVLLYSLFSIFITIDTTFNLLWEMNGRSIKQLLQIFFFVLLIPIGGIVLLAIRVSVASYFEGGVLREANLILLSTSIYVLGLFLSYKLIPKVTVKTKYAAISAAFCGITFAIMQYSAAYILGFFNSYQNIYGNLAGVLIMLLWVYFSWTLCLAGSRWNYLLQESQRLDQENQFRAVSHNYRKFLTLLVLAQCEAGTNGEEEGSFAPKGVAETMAERYNMPQHITMEIIDNLTDIGILFIDIEERHVISPSHRHCTINELIERIDTDGSTGFASQIAANEGKERELWEYINDKQRRNASRFDKPLNSLL